MALYLDTFLFVFTKLTDPSVFAIGFDLLKQV